MMKRLKILMLLLVFFIGAKAQTTDWNTNVTWTPSWRMVGGQYQYRFAPGGIRPFFYLTDSLNSKQKKLISGTNIKTINGQSLLGSGNLTISGGGGGSNVYASGGLTKFGDTIKLGGDYDGTIIIGGLGYKPSFLMDGDVVNSRTGFGIIQGTNYNNNVNGRTYTVGGSYLNQSANLSDHAQAYLSVNDQNISKSNSFILSTETPAYYLDSIFKKGIDLKGVNFANFTDSTLVPKKFVVDLIASSGGSANWGSIGGTLSNQTDLINALNLKLNSSTAASTYEPIFSKNTAFNKNFGTSSGTVAQGNDSRILNGQTAFGWGNHAAAGYLTSFTETDPNVPAYAKTLSAFSVIKSSTDPLYRPIGYVPTFSEITGKPTTLSAYGITDAYPLTGNPAGFLTSFTESDPNVPAYAKTLSAFSVIKSSTDPLYRPITYVPTFAEITSKPTNLSGYGITDAVPSSRTVNGQALSANIALTKSDVGLGNVDNTSDALKPLSNADVSALALKENTANKQNSLTFDGTGAKFPTVDAVNAGLAGKQATLVSATNIKTINGTSILGSGDLVVSGGGGAVSSLTTTGTSGASTLNAGVLNIPIYNAVDFYPLETEFEGAATALDKFRLKSAGVTVPKGGTGVNTLTGIVKGNGTAAFSAAVAGTDYLTPTGSAAGLTSFPTFNQNTTGSAASLTTARTIGVSGITGTAQSFNGTANITIPITAVPATLLTGTAAINTTGSAATLGTARTIGVSGVTGTAQSFNGSANITIPITAVPGSLVTGNISSAATGTTLQQVTTAGQTTSNILYVTGNTATTAPSSGNAVNIQNPVGSDGSIEAYNHTAGSPNTLRINPSGGSVLIGTSVNNGAKLQVNGTISGNGSLLTNLPVSTLQQVTTAGKITNDDIILNRLTTSTSSALRFATGGVNDWFLGTNAISNGSDFDFYNHTTSSINLRLVKTNGNVLVGTTTDNGVDKLQVNGSISATNLTAGSFTTTATTYSNVTSASTSSPMLYSRVGSIVTVSGNITVTPTAAGTTYVSLTKPIASNFTTITDASGTVTGAAVNTGGAQWVESNITSDNLDLYFNVTGGGTPLRVYFTAQYIIK